MEKNIETKRSFLPGTNWLYYKIYGGWKSLDWIVVNELYTITSYLKKHKYIDKWFFIRYNDPDPHLRVRFYIKNLENLSSVIIYLGNRFDVLHENKIISKVQIDTYKQEIERYGGNSLIATAESLFFLDSECTVRLLRIITKSKDENYRWLAALKIVDSYLSTFSFSLSEKQVFVSSRLSKMKTEFGYNEYNYKQINSLFRKHRISIETVFSPKLDETMTLLFQEISRTSKLLSRLIPVIQKDLAHHEELNIDQLLTSYLHMMINRLFIGKNLIHELVIYDFMSRYYLSRLAWDKKNID